MSLHEDTVSEVLGTYVRAWETQDPDLSGERGLGRTPPETSPR